MHVVFDLDGTLIDSAPAILQSYRTAFAAAGIEPVIPITEAIVGPPLLETLQLLAGTTDPARIADLTTRFKDSYDGEGYLATSAYPGVSEMLGELHARGLSLSIATNKRIHPTRLILAHLGWTGFFNPVYALDLFEPRLPNKAAMIARLLADCAIAQHDAVYVGDRTEDGDSAEANRLPFYAATWGYGSLAPEEMQPDWQAFSSPGALCQALLGR